MLDRLPGWTARPDVPDVRGVARTVRERREGILGYLGGRPADAYLEGANSLIQSIKKAARGFRNVEYLATAILPGLGGLSFDALACDPTQPVLPTRNPEEPIFTIPLPQASSLVLPTAWESRGASSSRLRRAASSIASRVTSTV